MGSGTLVDTVAEEGRKIRGFPSWSRNYRCQPLHHKYRQMMPQLVTAPREKKVKSRENVEKYVPTIYTKSATRDWKQVARLGHSNIILP